MEWIELLRAELAQKREEGCEVGRLEAQVATVDERTPVAAVEELYGHLSALQPAAGFPYREPSGLEAIRAERPAGPRQLSLSVSDEEWHDRVLGAWLGRCAGCALGKPVELWSREKIRAYLEHGGEYPLTDYVPLLEPLPPGVEFHQWGRQALRGQFQCMPRDDDIDYTILGLHILEQFGPAFTTEDVAQTWLAHLPYGTVFTAEKVAYRNLVNGLVPPETATYHNPYREWIGAQIRADAFGYAAAGLPETAASLAYRDAALSHVKNGIYGEMWAAAMVAAAFAASDVWSVLEIGLSEIPAQSRLAAAVREVMALAQQAPDWEQAWEVLNGEFGHYHTVHTINNAAVVALALICGQGDFERSITIAVMGGWDTDCNGATVGSIIGAMLGASRLPAKWIAPLGDRVRSDVAGYDRARISELARRTMDVGAAFR